MSTHLEQTRLVNKGFITVQKYFALLRIENGLITLRAGKERQLRLQHHNTTRVVYVFFVSAAFCVSIARITKLVLLQFFFRIKAGNPERARWAHLAHSGSQSKHRIRFILPTGAASVVIKLVNHKKYKKTNQLQNCQFSLKK